MDTTNIPHIARGLMNTYGLHHWTFGWDRAVRRFGCCHVRTRRITVSRPLAEVNGEDHARETILHEIAHAIVWEEHGPKASAHGPEWVAVAQEIGAQPTVCGDGIMVEPPLVGTCPGCNFKVRRHRRRRASCPWCSGGRYNDAFRLVWVDTRKQVAA